MKFVDVKNDIAFKKIFRNESKKMALISFLNAVLEFSSEKKIKDVTILNPYQLPALSGGKTTIVDVKAQDLQGNTFIVEMQIAEQKDFDKRVLYYAAQSYSNQIERGDLYVRLNSAFFIGILDFVITKNPEFISRHKIYDIETGEQILRDLEFHFIELPKFTKKQKEISTIIEQWVYFIKNAENLAVIPENITDEGLKEAFDGASRFNWTTLELEEYNKVFMREQDEKGRLELAEEKGKMAGEITGKIEIAIRAKKMGLTIDDIIKLTELTKEEIEKL